MKHKYLKLWEHPKNYCGETWYDYYPVAWQHRDSNVLERANFKAFTDLLGGESEHVIIEHSGHWLCGWVETLLLHKDAPGEMLYLAEKTLADLDDYPIIDESLHSEMEREYAMEIWNNCYNLAERVELCQEHDCSIFGARPGHFPADDNDYLFEYLVTP